MSAFIMMQNRRMLLAVAIASTVSCVEARTLCTFARLTPSASTFQLNGETIDLGEADAKPQPSAWQGPLRTRACTFPLGIIEAPIVRVAGRWLYVQTYSGSERHVSVLDTGSCKVRWTSPPFSGAIEIDGDALTMAGKRVPFDARCLPAQAK